jgi:hypothetical protein
MRGAGGVFALSCFLNALTATLGVPTVRLLDTALDDCMGSLGGIRLALPYNTNVPRLEPLRSPFQSKSSLFAGICKKCLHIAVF